MAGKRFVFFFKCGNAEKKSNSAPKLTPTTTIGSRAIVAVVV